MNKREKDRLLKLAEFLETKVPSEHFDMGTWGDGDFKKHECRSVACALGWATAVFPRSLKLMGDGIDEAAEVLHWKTGTTGTNAAQEFFGLTHDEATDLFMPGNGNDTVKQVTKNIRKVANAH